MTSVSSAVLCTGLLALLAFHWLAGRGQSLRLRADGVPALGLLRRSAAIDFFAALVFALAAALSGGRALTLAPAWRHDLWTALLVGALAGSFLHLVGGGTPLPIVALGRPRGAGVERGAVAGLGSIVLCFAGQAANVFVWFGVALPTLTHLLARLAVLPLVAGGYGLRRAAGGEDHAVLAAIDGLLLALLGLLTGSLLSVLVAQLAADVLAYVRAVGEDEEEDAAAEASPANRTTPGVGGAAGH